MHSTTNCGACGVNCTTMGLVNPRCIDGACVDTRCADVGLNFCGGACFSDADYDRDPLNCGGCGNVCANDEVCVAGNCERYSVLHELPGSACGAGATCCPYGTDAICVTATGCPAP